MSSKYEKYINEALAASGFAVLDSTAAFLLRGREIWSTPTEAWADSPRIAGLERIVDKCQGVSKFMADVIDADGTKRTVPVAARSADMLDRRLEWILGYRGVRITPVARFVEPKLAAPKPVPVDDAPPPYACHARDLWFEKHPGQVDPLKVEERRKHFGGQGR